MAAGRRAASVRPKERRRLLAALDAVVTGQGGVVEVCGDPGSGRTRLLGELTRQATRRGVPVVTGRCTASDRMVPFGVFQRLLSIRPSGGPADGDSPLPGALLAGLLADGSDGSAGAEARDLLDPARLLLARTAGEGLVVVVDDLHWADDASIALIDHLVRWPVQAPLLLAVSHRPRQSPARLLAALAHGEELGTVDRITLTPLRMDQAARLTGLAEDDTRLARLVEASEANPRYLLGLLHLAERPGIAGSSILAAGQGLAPLGSATAEWSSEHLVGPVRAELEELGPDCARAAWAAVVLNAPFDVDTLAAVAGLGIDETCAALSALVARDLLRPVDGDAAYRLCHPLLGTLLYATLDPGWRRRAHHRAARALDLAGAPPAVLAPHIERFPQDSGLREVHLLADAAREAMAGSPPDAVRWLRLAIRILALADCGEPQRVDRLRGELSMSLARAYGAAGMLAESRTQIRETLELASARPPTQRAAIVSLCAIFTYANGQHADGLAIIAAEIDAVIDDAPGATPENARPFVRPQARPAVIALLLTRASIGLLEGTPPSPGDLGLLLDLALAQGDRTAEVGALALRAVVEAFGGDIPTAALTVARCIALADHLPDAALADHPEHLALLGWADSVLGRQLDAERHFSRGAALARSSGRGEVLPLLLSGLGAVYQRVGRLPEARAIAAEMAHLIRNSHRGHHTSLAEAIEALAGIWIDGQGSRRAAAIVEQAAAERSTALPAARRSWWSDVAAVWTAYAAAADGGDPRRTIALILDTGGGQSLQLVSPVLHPMAFEALTVASGRLGDLGAASRFAELAEGAAERLGLGYQRGHALAARAHALRGMAQPGPAGALYEQAADLFGAAGMLSLRTYLLVQAGRCLTAAGRPEEASRQFTTAGELARRCGANRLGRQALAALRGLPEVGQAGNVLDILTPREREIAAAAVRGRTSRQIAQDLGLSPRTVDAHLTRVYRKLGVASRVALLRLVNGAGPR